MTSGPVNVGIVGCGAIAGIYFKNLSNVLNNVQITACADLDSERSAKFAAEYPSAEAMTTEELLARPDIQIVVNLTIPKAHFSVAMQAVQAGKSVYNEKPLCLTRDEGQRLLDAAKEAGVRVGGAPDTFLGGGLQTCRKLIDDGEIGTPVGATAFMLCHGHESWHPDPEFYYEVGGGPMFDMGPYYLTALVALMGSVSRVTGSTRITFPERTITSKKKNGKVIQVEVPTTIAGVMDFANGAIGTIVTSFDIWAHQLPRIEIYGSKGTLAVPDPNGFGGPVRIRRAGAKEWEDVELTHGYAENSRGLGVADMAAALTSGGTHRANGDLTYHVLDLMHAFHDASDQGCHVKVESTVSQPAAMPADLAPGDIDP